MDSRQLPLVRALLPEVARWLCLTVAVGWLMSAYWGGQLVGGGDAVWYHHQISDAAAQFRAGEFPLWVGQSSAAFNGAVHPFRSAPLLLYLAGGLDLLSGHQATAAELLNRLAFLMVWVAAFSAYFALNWLAPRARWRAAALAWLYVACPGVVGLAVAQDLFMSLTALPFLPWVLASAARVRPDRRSGPALALGASLGGLWWAHAPMALWSTAAVGLWLGIRLLVDLRRPGALLDWLGSLFPAALTLGLVASYPFVSVLSLRQAGEAVVPATLARGDVLREIFGVFPAILRPLSSEASLLSFLQPGYSLLLLVGVAMVLAARGRAPDPLRSLSGGATALALGICLVPVPGLTVWVWHHLPEFWVSMTNLWPMQRIVPLLAGLAVILWQATRAEVIAPPAWERAVLILCVAWTTYQADEVRTLARRHQRAPDATARLAFPENVNVSAYCYQQLPQRPATFIHGVTSAEMELRWSEPVSSGGSLSNRAWVEANASVPWQDPELRVTENPGLFRSKVRWSLQPGQTYLLSFAFSDLPPAGVLRLQGERIDRVYTLPSAGDARGFGVGPDQDKSLVVWTSLTDHHESMALEFIPAADIVFDPRRFAAVRLLPIDRANLPVRLESLVPLRVQVNRPGAVRLETPRVWIPGWRAEHQGQTLAVQRSRQGLVEVSVAGPGEIALRYVGSPTLRGSFWLGAVSLFSTVVGLVALAGLGLRRDLFIVLPNTKP